MNPNYPQQQPSPQRRRRRRKKTKMQIFKERYLPLLVLLLGAILVIALIVGLVKLAFRGGGNENTIPAITVPSTEAPGPGADEVLNPAKVMASQYDYDGAIALLEGYTGEDSRIQTTIDEYNTAKATLVPWSDNTKIPHISFQNLIVDTDRAFDGDSASEGYADYNLTTEEFTAILQQLYDNGFVLVSMTDIAGADDAGTFAAKTISLPSGKKPIVISFIPAHYTLDRAGDGFARRLMIGDDGKIAAEYIDASATRQYGAYDPVSILEGFLTEHPDFSYHGARMILGVNGESEPLGYDITNEEQVPEFKKVAQHLMDLGYEFASFTHDGLRYGDAEDADVATDVKAWEDCYTDLLGDVQILVYAGGSDLLDYQGTKYDALYGAGFRYFVGMDNDTEAWGEITDKYARQDRRTINGTRITEDKDLVDDLFDAGKVVSSKRP